MPEGQQEQRAESARLVPGVRLLGEYQGSGFVEPRYLVARSDGQLLHVSRLLFLVASALRESVSPTSAAQQVSAAYGRTLTPDGLVLLVEHKLQPMGLACVDRPAHPRAAVPPAPGPPSAPALRSKPLLALRFRRVLLSQGATRVVAAALAPLFTPVVVVALVGSLLATDTWLVRSASLDTAVADTLRTPPVMLLLLAILLGSTLFHEFGHAAACRYGGATPGAIGVALYVVYPAFYTDVTQSYRLGRAGRVRTDLGGVYFNAISALALTALYAQTAYAPLLLAIALVHLELVQQLLPLARLDGYFIVADLIGVPDLFSRVGPILSSLVPGRGASPRVRELRPAARAVVTIWVLTAVPVMVGLLAVLVWQRAEHGPDHLGVRGASSGTGCSLPLSTVDPPARAAGAAVHRAAPAPPGGPRPAAGRDRATRSAPGHASGRASFPLISGPQGGGPTLTGGHDVRTIICTPAVPDGDVRAHGAAGAPAGTLASRHPRLRSSAPRPPRRARVPAPQPAGPPLGGRVHRGGHAAPRVLAQPGAAGAGASMRPPEGPSTSDRAPTSAASSSCRNGSARRSAGHGASSSSPARAAPARPRRRSCSATPSPATAATGWSPSTRTPTPAAWPTGCAARPPAPSPTCSTERNWIERYADMRGFTSQAADTRLEVVASDDDPRISQALGRGGLPHGHRHPRPPLQPRPRRHRDRHPRQRHPGHPRRGRPARRRHAAGPRRCAGRGDDAGLAGGARPRGPRAGRRRRRQRRPRARRPRAASGSRSTSSRAAPPSSASRGTPTLQAGAHTTLGDLRRETRHAYLELAAAVAASFEGAVPAGTRAQRAGGAS